MDRIKGLLLAGMVPVVVCGLAAGPAGAAQGGNRDAAHACQQGGHENRFEAETGNPFKNAGDCAGHEAQGGSTATLKLTTDTYPCGTGCTYWGYVYITGLSPGEDWVITTNGGMGYTVVIEKTDVNGNVNGYQANLPCGTGPGAGGSPFQLSSFVAGGNKIWVNVNAPC
jgi:hypothetical protein